MSWNAIAALAQALAAAGVILSVVYLALQVRQNTDHIRLNSESLGVRNELGGARMSVDIGLALAGDPEMSELVLRARQREPDLTRSERMRYGSFLYAALAAFQAGYYNHQKGFADANAWKGHEGDLLQVIRNPAARSWWARERARFSPQFAEYVDDLMKRHPLGAGERTGPAPGG